MFLKKILAHFHIFKEISYAGNLKGKFSTHMNFLLCIYILSYIHTFLESFEVVPSYFLNLFLYYVGALVFTQDETES